MGKLDGCFNGPDAGRCQVHAAEDKVLNVYNWVDYIGPDTIKIFEARTGNQGHLRCFRQQRCLAGQAAGGEFRVRCGGADLGIPSADDARRVPFMRLGPCQAAQLEAYGSGAE